MPEPHSFAVKIKREQLKAIHRLRNPKLPATIQQVRAFSEPCFKCGAARECKHRENQHG